MMGLIIAIHVIACILLIAIILVQTGRGGGLVDSFSGIESMFGTKTNKFLTNTTGVLSTLFILTCLSLAFLSARQSRSLLKDVKPIPQAATQSTAVTTEAAPPPPQAQPELPKQEAAAPVKEAPLKEIPANPQAPKTK